MKKTTLKSSYVLCLCLLLTNRLGIYAEKIANYPSIEELKSSEKNSSRELHQRQKRGLKSGAWDRIAHGFGKRTMYTRVNRLTDLLSSGFREDDIPVTKIGMPVIQLAKQFVDDQNTLVDYLSSFIDKNGDGFLEPTELFGDQYVPDL